MTRDELVAMAEERGVEIDKRWKSEKIAEALGLQVKPDAEPVSALAPGMKRVCVTKFGAGKVSNGKGGYKNDEGRIAYGKCAQNDELVVPAAIAERLESKGFAEII